MAKDYLEKQIKDDFDNIQSLPEGDEKNTAIDNVVKLYKLKIEEDRLEAEFNDKFDEREREYEDKLNERELKANQAKVQNIQNWVMGIGQLLMTVLGFVAYDIWNKRGLKFEETGTIAAQTNRNLFSKLTPKK